MGPTRTVFPLAERAPKITIVGTGTQLRGVITDWGGVLTSPILATVRAWIEADDIDWNSYRGVIEEERKRLGRIIAFLYLSFGKIYALFVYSWGCPGF